MTVPAEPDPAPAAPAPAVSAPAAKPKVTKTKVTKTIIVQTIFISVVSVIVGKLADRFFPTVWKSGIVGAVLGAVVGGFLSVGFDKLAKRRRPVPPGIKNV